MRSIFKHRQYIIGGMIGGAIMFFIMTEMPSFLGNVSRVPKKKITPTSQPTNEPTPTTLLAQPTDSSSLGVSPSPTSVSLPAQVLDLTDWKVTLPIGDEEKPTEVKQPVLATYQLAPWFTITSDKRAVLFRAPVNGVTTSGSSYPRSELREMREEGKVSAGWSSTSGVHTMTIEQAVTAVPKKKQHVVAGQIHDADDDVVVVRLEYPKLYVNVDGDNVHVLDENYTLGKRFTVTFEVKNGQTSIYYNGSSEPAYTFNKSYSGAYFKAGAYTQSNCSREETSDCNSDNYGEVIIYSLDVNHN